MLGGGILGLFSAMGFLAQWEAYNVEALALAIGSALLGAWLLVTGVLHWAPLEGAWNRRRGRSA